MPERRCLIYYDAQPPDPTAAIDAAATRRDYRARVIRRALVEWLTTGASYDRRMVAEFQFRYNNPRERRYLWDGDQRMLNKYEVLIAFALFVVATTLLIGAREFSSKFQECQAKQYAETSAPEHPERLSQFIVRRVIASRCTARYIRRENAAITAIATLLIAAFTGTLWMATSRQAQLTREALIADKKAFVFVTTFNQTWTKDEITGVYAWQFRPVLRNSGDTPTRGMRTYVNCEILDSRLPDGFDFTAVEANVITGTIPPKFELQGGLAPLGRFISPQDIVECQNGRRFIYLWGWVEYNDVFPRTKKHITKFCWVIHITGDPYGFIPNTQGSPPTPGVLHFGSTHHREGNCIDDECHA